MKSKFFEFFKTFLFVFIIFAFIILLTNIWLPNVAYAMEPSKDFVVDYYSGAKEYIGTDAYGYFNNSINVSPILTSSDIILSAQEDSYGKSNQEVDWYSTNDPHIIQPIIVNNNKSVYTLFLSIKRRTYWYIWKIHSDDFSSYKHFKQAWNPKNSIRKEILQDIKSFGIKK